jgi:Mlc titration factor MtfA (ptsG expression regulator)
MLENFIHEAAHALESDYGMFIYDDSLIQEFKGKRNRLYHLISAEGYHINPQLYKFTEYNEKFDNFLANEVGYPVLLSLTMGLFISPYGATSIREYFANGFEKYFLGNPRAVRDISPILYRKIEEIINDNEA